MPGIAHNPVVRLAINSALILTLNAAAGITACYALQTGWHPKRSDTFGSLFFIGKNEHHNLVFLGGSRAYTFTACESTARKVDDVLGQPILHISGYGNGAFPIRAYVNHYYDRGNTVDHFVYFVDTPLFYADRYNEQMPRIRDEPLRLSFALALLRDGVPLGRIIEYTRSKFCAEWLAHETPKDHCQRRLPGRVLQQLPRKTKRINAILYPDGVSTQRLNRSMEYVQDVLQTARYHGARVTFVILPTLLIDEPGKRMLVDRLQPLINPPNVTFQDFGGEMAEPKYFFDMHHMNETGALHFTKTYLAPFLTDHKN